MIKKKARRINPIYVSPDGGETVYEQLPNGARIMLEQSQKAKDEEQTKTVLIFLAPRFFSSEPIFFTDFE